MSTLFTRNISLGMMASAAAATAIKFSQDTDEVKLKKQHYFTEKKTRKIDEAKLKAAIRTATDAVRAYKV
jgi:hypothetical protein